MPQPIATWNPARGAWEAPGTANLLCEHSDLYSPTWPTSGTTRRGTAYGPPTSVPLTAGSVSSSSPGLPTPTSRDWKGPNQRQDASCLHGALLPTPTASEATGAGYTDRVNGGGRNLRTEVSLLPTPVPQEPGGTVEQYRARLHAADGRTSTFTPLGMLVESFTDLSE